MTAIKRCSKLLFKCYSVNELHLFDMQNIKHFLLNCIILFSFSSFAQKNTNAVSMTALERHVKILSSDKLAGREAGTFALDDKNHFFHLQNL